jgi:phosphoglycolate phosphatase
MVTTRTHVLLDLDGTISDSSVGIGRSLQHAFESCGLTPPTETQVRAVIGPPFEISLPRLGVPAADLERVVAAYHSRYESVGLYENDLYEGVVEMIDALAADHTLAIATAKPESTAARIVEHFGLADRFAAQVGATVEIGSARRTKAAVITHALERLGIRAGDHVVMVGDRDHDVEGALANGLDCIGVAWGFGSPDELTAAGAVVVADTPARVVEAVSGKYRGAEP